MFILVCIIEQLTRDRVSCSVCLWCHTDRSNGGKRREDMKATGDERMSLLFKLLFSMLHINIYINAALSSMRLGTS